MYWKFDWLDDNAQEPPLEQHGRFALHRHTDESGPHLDLRLEQAGFLAGWRLASEALESTQWGISKSPHPREWLDQAQGREASGVYAWRGWDGDEGVLELYDGERTWRCRVTRLAGLSAERMGQLVESVHARGRALDELPALVEDGLTARERSVARLCALGKELDASHFEEQSWRALLAKMPLREIDRHLHGFEVRFDAKYPPQPVSLPDPLEDETEQRGRAWSILTGA
ncbi:MAG: hypothetical protein HYV27_19290 [Candidatus Hydrogenedentes bacterium]|nr:hypothetical protein [Candidatus Hydrogenedentota bacterium]